MEIEFQRIQEQISYIIFEHKDCGGICQNTKKSYIFKENEHLASLIAYYVKGVCDGI
jgi:hypothetical protein